MAATKKHLETVSLRLPAQVIHQLNQRAGELDTNRSSLLRVLVEDALQQNGPDLNQVVESISDIMQMGLRTLDDVTKRHLLLLLEQQQKLADAFVDLKRELDESIATLRTDLTFFAKALFISLGNCPPETAEEIIQKKIWSRKGD